MFMFIIRSMCTYWEVLICFCPSFRIFSLGLTSPQFFCIRSCLVVIVLDNIKFYYDAVGSFIFLESVSTSIGFVLVMPMSSIGD